MTLTVRRALSNFRRCIVMGKRSSTASSIEDRESDLKKRQKKSKKVAEDVDETKESKKGVVNQKEGAPHSWCNTYPGSLPSLISPSIKKWNMKLCSWNINGLRAWIKNGGLRYLSEESPDFLSIQETKCASDKIPAEAHFQGYEFHWSSAEKNGYAGTALYSKTKPLNITRGVGKTTQNPEGRVITAEFPDFYLVSVYVPNSGQGLVRLPYRQHQWDPEFRQHLKELDKIKPIIVTGDLNVAHEEIDLANPSTNHRSAGFTDEERENFTKLLKEVDLVDTYRALYPDRENAYTFWSYRKMARSSNTGWRLDYFLVSRRIMPNVCDHEIRCGVQGSDHCPIVLYLNF
ncbi:hypothetical protein CRM22_011057 [Opisthorchis felineus]|uniref:exodeoxyribonuclease III n=2 Tax=Opisthorchis felineus TaxID=147828 RepID=A0A4S2KDT5_OPIFE|nr:hypothetical protein CRM22_011057 [Opisthorchis felineus]